jgi:DNA-binding transcriptional regulator LsrR (DeoR family)
LINDADAPQLLAIATDQLRPLPPLIGIAVGIDKTKAVVEAARADRISTLVTDTVTAQAIAASSTRRSSLPNCIGDQT